VKLPELSGSKRGKVGKRKLMTLKQTVKRNISETCRSKNE
jgi:hypothetical protein